MSDSVTNDAAKENENVDMSISEVDIIDAGLNLLHRKFHNDDFRYGVLETSRAKNVVGALLIGTSLGGSKQNIEFINQYNKDRIEGPKLWTTAGIHPNSTGMLPKNWTSRLRELIILNKNNIVAIGECGLDSDRIPEGSSIEKQKEVFFQQMKIADIMKLPVYLHCRGDDVAEDFINILKGFPKVKKLVHCFYNEKPSFLSELKNMNCSFGITGMITYFHKSRESFDKLVERINEIPLNKLVIETDAPFLTPRNIPQQYRENNDNTNMPYNVVWVLDKLATIRKESYEDIGVATTTNFLEFFKVSL